jgi:hypothetical protein
MTGKKIPLALSAMKTWKIHFSENSGEILLAKKLTERYGGAHKNGSLSITDQNSR